MKKNTLILGMLILVMGFSGLVSASTDLLGMGNAPGPAAPGDNGFEWNPAAINPGTTFVIDLAILNTNFRTDALSVMDILEYGGFVEGSDSYWTKEEVDEILGKIPDDGLSLYLNHTTRPKIIIGPVGLSSGVQAFGRGTLDKDIFNLILKGNSQYVDLDGDTQTTIDSEKLFDLTDTQADVLATADAAFSLSIPLNRIKAINKRFDEFYIGGSYHMVAGGYGNLSLTDETRFYLSYGDPDENGLQVVNIRFADNQTINQKLDSLEEGELYPLIRAIYTLDLDNPTDTSYLGMGSALDLGIYAKKGRFSFGLSCMNMGALNFDKYQILEYGIIKDTTQDMGFSLIEEPQIRQGTKPIKVPLPSRINAGVSYKLGHWLLAGVQLSRINSISVNLDENEEMIYSSRVNYELGAGLELNPIWILPVRVGILKTKNSLIYTGGFGLHLGPLKTDIGVAANYKSASVGVNTSIEF